MKKLKTLFILSLVFFVFYGCISNDKAENKVDKIEHSAEYKNVELAILDYVEGLYLVDSTRIDKSVDTKLRKIGYWYNADEKGYRDHLEMTHKQLSNLAASWNTSGDRANEESPKIIEIFDINSKTASAKLTAEWGIDLFHLAKVHNQWKIVNVMWQSQPEKE
ncbi:nuclear transport factor 2 family protein [uncultured Polaribacter sp.]|uniref:nuclear transport factor 2 family protein n=1 Tax=uncultured Polaribacter sp. TaxID=174711 RepID=UPI0026397DD4|nr:nuclear transport factor 2 family protein [uncultured Polaribacter sp.]